MVGETIKLLFATDIPEAAAGVDPALPEAEGIEIVATARDVSDILNLVTLHQPDVVVIDYDMADLDAGDVTRAILREDPTIQIIMLSLVGDVEDIRGAMRVGARDYLVKPLQEGELVETIRWLIGERREYARMQAFVRQLRRAYEALFTDDKAVPPTVVAFLEQQVARDPHNRLAQETLAVAYARNREWKKLAPLVEELARTEIG